MGGTRSGIIAEVFKELKNGRAFIAIRLFIQYLKVPLISLDENSELHKLSKKNNWKDSINAIGKVRNLIVHPKVNKNSDHIETSEIILHEVFNLANSYLLRCLLKIFEYPCNIGEM